MMSTNNDERVMTLDSETPRPESVLINTGEERSDDICRGINDAVTLKPQGGVEADNPTESDVRRNLWKSTIKIATWNVRTLNQGKLDILTNELDRNDVHLAGISEIRWTGKGHFTTLDKHVVYYSGTETKRERGVAFIANQDVAKCVLGYNPINDRIMTIRIHGNPMNMTVIQAYAPTSASSDEEIQQFYEQLQQTIDGIHKRDILIVTGDFNAKVGARSTNKHVMGNYGLGDQNERGEMLVDFCQENQFSIINTQFKQHPRRLYTWSSPDQRTRNQIDYILVQGRWRSSFMSAKTLPGADCGSDHQLLVCTMKMKLRRIKRQQKPVRFDVTKINEQYRVEVKNKFQSLLEKDSEDSTPEELWQSIKEVVSKTAHRTLPRCKKKKKPWLTGEVFRLADQRRNVKSQGLKNKDQCSEYSELSRRIQRQIRRDKTSFINMKCAAVERDCRTGNAKDMYKGIKDLTSKPVPRLNVLKDENGNILTEDIEIKSRWKQYCEKLYASQEDEAEEADLTNIEDNNIVDNEPDILISEVIHAMKKLKNGKSPGVDNIQAELLKESDEEGVEIIHRLCNKIWIRKEWPADWKKAVFLPLPKKGDTRECANNRTISLISHASKILLNVIVERIRDHLEKELPPEQAGFRRGRGTRNQIAKMRNRWKKHGVSTSAISVLY